MARPIEISKSEKLNDGVCVWFTDGVDDECYYAHGINQFGTPKSPDADDSMWGWINHMSHKVWWNQYMQEEFIKEVKKYL